MRDHFGVVNPLLDGHGRLRLLQNIAKVGPKGCKARAIASFEAGGHLVYRRRVLACQRQGLILDRTYF